MTLFQIILSLNLQVFSSDEYVDQEISGGYASDLLSDVLAHAKEGQIWVTVQTHKNVLAVASMKRLSAILLVNGLEPDGDMLEQNQSERIPILGTNLSAFEIIGELYILLDIAHC